MQLLSLQFQLYGSSKKVLTQKVVTILEEAGFSFNYSCVQSLFGSQLSSPSNLHVLAMSVHNIVRSTNASCWPTTHGGKKVRRPSVFKITQQHTNNWEVGILLTQCTVFPPIDVPSPRYGQIYSIVLDDQRYDVTIGNFLGCSCVYFVKMLVGSLGARGVYVHCKHVYHVLQMIMFCGLMEEFIHHCTWSWDEVQRLLKSSKVFELL